MLVSPARQILIVIVMIAIVSLFAQNAVAGGAAELPDLYPAPTAVGTAAPVQIYSWARDHCEKGDFPDAPARAFRDDKNVVHLFASGHDAFPFLGSDLYHLRHDCSPAFRSALNGSPEQFADLTWLTSFFTYDGHLISAIAHNEYHGTHHGACPSHDERRCSYVALVSIISTDGGKDFSYAPLKDRVIVAPAQRYKPDMGLTGYMNPSNVVSWQDYYYVFFNAIQSPSQRGGVCLMRSPNPADPSSWRVWNGQTFGTFLGISYGPGSSGSAQGECQPLGLALGHLQGVSVLRSDETGKFLMIGQMESGPRKGRWPLLTPYVSTSTDLIHWTTVRPLLSLAEQRRIGSTWYPTIIDPSSTDRTFSTVGTSGLMFFVRPKNDSVWDRDFLYIRVDLTQATALKP